MPGERGTIEIDFCQTTSYQLTDQAKGEYWGTIVADGGTAKPNAGWYRHPGGREMKRRSGRTLWTAPAVLSMNAGFQFPSVEIAVKPASVIPAANGCYKQTPMRHRQARGM